MMMKTIIAIFCHAFSISAVIASEDVASTHTTCYNYFLQKDGCVYSAASPTERCPAPKKEHPAAVQPFTLQNKQPAESTTNHRLMRRYDATKPSFPIASGTGICGFYNSTEEIGVCLWSGAEQQNPTPETAGWLNGPNLANCGKRVYVQRTGQPETVQFAKVVDGCSFNTPKVDVGCFEIGVTIALFNALKPTPEEQQAQLITSGITWDFDNLNGCDPQQAPV